MTDENQTAGVNPRLVRPPGWSPKLHLDLAKMPDQERAIHVVNALSTFTGEGTRAEMSYHFFTNSLAVHRFVLHPAWTPWTRGASHSRETLVESLEEFAPYVTDEKMLEVCQSIVKQRQLLDDINGQLGQVLADFLGLPAPGTEEGFQELQQQVDDHRLEHGPTWTSQAEIQPLILKLKDIFVEAKSLEVELHARLRPYYESLTPSSEEMGDERAKDLVDQAEGADAKTAIRLLKKALQYGKTGIQASKAYMELGGRYSDLGETEKAIEHYTKSFEAYKHPNAFALYWRGELYYQQEEWDKARSDFEQAVAIGLYSPEYEQAQEYLSELGARESGEGGG